MTFGGIFNPAGERQVRGHFFGCETVGDALDSACYDEMDGWHLVIRWVIDIGAKVRISGNMPTKAGVSGKWLKKNTGPIESICEVREEGQHLLKLPP